MKKTRYDTRSYAAFVRHPRYGQGPQYSGCDPSPYDADVHFHWNATDGAEIRARYRALTGTALPWGYLGVATAPRRRIPGTAVKADLARQSRATVPVTHYFDVERNCRDCGRPFIFYANEQKHWYETLQFPLEADCIRCPVCRKTGQAIARYRAVYERLLAKPDRSPDETERLLDAVLSLIEQGVFSPRKLEPARRLVKTLPECRKAPFAARIAALGKGMAHS